MGIIIALLPILQMLSCGITIWGFVNTADFSQAAVEYGAFGDANSPDAAMWINSIGSIAFGLVGFVGTQIGKHRLGFTSELWQAGKAWLAKPTDTVATFRFAFAVVCMLSERLADPNNADDVAAIAYMKGWLTDKLTQRTAPNLK